MGWVCAGGILLFIIVALAGGFDGDSGDDFAAGTMMAVGGGLPLPIAMQNLAAAEEERHSTDMDL